MEKVLKRSRNNRMIGGVCGGIGEYLEVDPTFVRLVWAAAIFMYGTGFLLYILAWIIIPEE
ncbi:MAG: PspC domain-containing protein [Methanolobus sp.]